MIKSRLFLPFLFSVVAAFGMIAGMYLQESLQGDGYLIQKTNVKHFDPFDEALNHVESKYYGELNYEEVTSNLIKTLASKLDPYSHYFEKDEKEEYEDYLLGVYDGIGVELVEFDGSLFISKVLKGSSAERAGVKVSYEIIAYDTINIREKGLSRSAFLKLARADVGDSLDLKFYDRNTDQHFSLKIEVAQIKSPIVHLHRTSDSTTVYIRIDRFHKSVFKELMSELEPLTTVSYVILDLRNNPGGIMDEAVKILNQFIPEKGSLLLSSVNSKNSLKPYLANGRTFLHVNRIVVLINEHSASASEILAGSLQDHDKAVIIGTKSFGKGFIQQNFTLSNKGSMNLTIGEYILPSGRRLNAELVDSVFLSINSKRALRQDKGIIPDIVVEEPCKLNESYHAMLSKLMFFTENGPQSLLNWTAEDWEKLKRERKELMDCPEMVLDLRWDLYNTLAGDNILSTQFMDDMVLKAFDLIRSERYESKLRPE